MRIYVVASRIFDVQPLEDVLKTSEQMVFKTMNVVNTLNSDLFAKQDPTSPEGAMAVIDTWNATAAAFGINREPYQLYVKEISF